MTSTEQTARELSEVVGQVGRLVDRLDVVSHGRHSVAAGRTPGRACLPADCWRAGAAGGGTRGGRASRRGYA